MTRKVRVALCVVSVLGAFVMPDANALDGKKDSGLFPHSLEFETDGELPWEEGAADGWGHTGWNLGQPPSLEVSGGTLKVDTVGVGGGHDLRQPTTGSAWADEVDPGTSYTFETRLKVTDQGGSDPGFAIWLGNGSASETAVVMVRTDSVSWGTHTSDLDTGDNSADFVTIRVAHHGDTGLTDVWKDGTQIGTDLGASDLTHANNWIILADFGGADEVAAEVDFIRWTATGALDPSTDSSTFDHKLEFETDGQLPSEEGAADGWDQVGWNIAGIPPAIGVSGGLCHFDSFASDGGNGGNPWISMESGSAWETEVVATGASFTLETSLKVTSTAGEGMVVWLGNGSQLLVLKITTESIRADNVGGGILLYEGDNSSENFSLRVGYDSAAQLYSVWRNGVLVGDGLAAPASGDVRVILIDGSRNDAAAGELDYVRWDSSGAYVPEDGMRDPSELAHCLQFETDGELPWEEGAADGWGHTGWNFGDPPSIEVSGGLLKFNSFTSGGATSGAPWIVMDGGSAWEAEVDGSTSYTIELSLRVISTLNNGVAVWASSGAQRLILNVTETAVTAAGTGDLATGLDNTTAQIALRIAYDASANTFDVWREGTLIGDDIAPSAADTNNRLGFIDTSGSYAVEGEIDFIRWTATGAVDPSTDSSSFDHGLEFETAGQLPSEEGAADGWAEVGFNIAGLSPSISVSGGLCHFDSFDASGGTGGNPWISMEGGSAWATEVATPGASFTLEVSVRATVTTGGGVMLWLGSGSAGKLLILHVYTDSVVADNINGGTTLHEGDNSTELVAVRVGFDSATGLHSVWRNGILIGDGLSAQSNGDARCILIDGSRNFAVQGEFDYVCWEAGGVYPPVSVEDETPPQAPTGLVAAAGPSVVALDWDSNTEDDLASYNVYRSETAGGPYDLIGSSSGSAYIDADVAEDVTYYYVVTAIDGSDNESEQSEEASAAPGFNDPAEVDSFGHCLHFETDGELPPVEGAADGWTLDATWNATPETPPTMSVSGGLLHFESVLAGQHAMIMPSGGASAWSTEIDPSVSYTLELSVRVESGTGGVVIWAGNGATRLILRVDTNGIFTWAGDQLHDGDNSTRLIAVRVGYDAVSGLYYVWRNGNLIGNGVPASATTGNTWVILIDCCSSTQATGEFDYVCWDSTGLYPPTSSDDGVPPAAPTGLVAQGSISVVALDWDSNTEDDLAGYSVFRSQTAEGPYELVAESIVASEFTDTAVVNGMTYYYVVTALDIWGGESDGSDEANATPSDPVEAGAASFPHCLQFNEDGVLPSVEGAADGWAEDAPWNQNDPDPPILNVFGGRLIFESVLPEQQAITMAAGSAWESEINSGVSYTMEVSLKVTAASGDLPGVVLWLANGATRLVLRVDMIGVSTWSGLELDTEGDNSTEFVAIRIGYDAVSGLYYVWRNGILIGEGVPPDAAAHQGRTAVFLIDCCSTVQVAGEFDYVCWTSGGIYGPDLTAPAAPTVLSATAGESQVSLDWNDNGEADLAGYDVFRAEVSGGPFDAIAVDVVGSEYVDGTAQNDVTYFYVVAAVDTSGNVSDASNEASATPADVTAPMAPQGLAATAGDQQVALDWDDNSEGDLDGYNVLRSEVSGGPYDEIASGVALSEYLDETAENDVTYYYAVTAVDTSGNVSEASAEVSATPEAPGGLQLPGNANQDGQTDMSDAIVLFDFLFLGNVGALPCGDTTREDPANVALLDWNDDKKIDLSDGIGLLNHLFQGMPGHPLGADCVRIIGCPEACTP